MKKLFNLLLIIFVSTNIVKAVPHLTGFSVLSSYLQNGDIKVYDTGNLEFYASITGTRQLDGSGTGSYENGQMEIVFYAVKNNVETALKTLNISSSNFEGGYLAYNETPSNAGAMNLAKITLPINLNSSQIRVKYRYKDSQGNWVSYISLSTTYNTVNLSPLPSKMPIYLVSHKGSLNDANDIFQLQTNSILPQAWHSSGIDFKAYTIASSVERLGAVPIYQHKYEVFDMSASQLGDPREIFFYSTSASITPTPFTGHSYTLVSTIVAFYAFNTQITGTIPVYRCSHKNAPIQVYRSSDADINTDLYDTEVAFYAYHWND